jgi:nitrogen fixation protein FixH
MRRFIMMVVLVVFVATVGTIYVGSRSFDGIVDDRPYEAGLAWDETQKRQARLGWRITFEAAALKVGRNEVVLRLSDRNGHPLNGATVGITVSRPSTRDYDRTYVANPIGGGRYQASLAVPLIGWWDLRTVVTRGSDSYTAIERIEATE